MGTGVQPISVNRIFVLCSGMLERSLLLVCHTEGLFQSPCHRRPWATIKSTLGQRLSFAGMAKSTLGQRLLFAGMARIFLVGHFTYPAKMKRWPNIGLLLG